MKSNRPYKPVACDLIDYIEIFATQGKKVEVIYQDANGIHQSYHTVLKTWETEDQVEYLVTEDGKRHRMDDVIAIEGISNKGA